MPFSWAGADLLSSGKTWSASSAGAEGARLLNCAIRSAISLSVRNSRFPNSFGRSIGVPVSATDHLPCRSGSPHAVRPTVDFVAPRAEFCPCAATAPEPSAIVPTALATTTAEARIRHLISRLPQSTCQHAPVLQTPRRLPCSLSFYYLR